jgi:cobalt-zinc-cadmium resistance protein CzcA
MPVGYRLQWTGSFENEQRAEKRLAIVVPITIAAIFFLLFIAFDSAKFATLILLTVPFAAAGGIMALPVAGLNMSVAALVGFVALFGVSIQNSVILVTRVRELRRQGRNMLEAIKEGASAHGPFQRRGGGNRPSVRRRYHRWPDYGHGADPVPFASALSVL